MPKKLCQNLPYINAMNDERHTCSAERERVGEWERIRRGLPFPAKYGHPHVDGADDADD